MVPPDPWIELNALPYRSAQALLRDGAPVYLLANPVEYHGPHLSLRNDHWIAAGLVRDLAVALREIAPGPAIYGGEIEVAVEPASGPGSRHTEFATVRRIAAEACRRVAELGARRVVVMTFHGSPLHSQALWHGVELLRRAGIPAYAPLNTLFRALLNEDDGSLLAPAYAPVADPAARTRLLAGARTDLHAGYLETSLALHYAPQTVGDHAGVPPCPHVTPDPIAGGAAAVARTLGRTALAAELELAAFGLGWYQLRPFPGYTSEPALASAEAGRAFAELAVDRMAPAARKVLYEGAPPDPPLMPWLEAASLGGRLLGQRVPVDEVGAV